MAKYSLAPIEEPVDRFKEALDAHRRQTRANTRFDLKNSRDYDHSLLRHNITQLERDALNTFLTVVRDVSKLVDANTVKIIESYGQRTSNNYLSALIKMWLMRSEWLRPIEAWKPDKYNTYRQFCSLADHLFGQYKVPTFLYSLWFHHSEDYIAFIEYARGTSVKKLGFHHNLNNKARHLFTQAPGGLTVGEALRWAQVKALGGDHQLVQNVLAVQGEGANTYCGSFRREQEEHFYNLLFFYCQHPMFDRTTFVQAWDFVKYETANNRPFSFKGRTPQSLLRLVQEWHATLALQRNLRSQGIRKDTRWEPSGIANYEKTIGSVEDRNYKLIQIKEILSYKELADEGRRMKHCVGSYAQSCIERRTAIFSFVRADLWATAEGKNSLTVEVALGARSITQVRGLQNRKALDSEMKVIREWASAQGLSISRYLS